MHADRLERCDAAAAYSAVSGLKRGWRGCRAAHRSIREAGTPGSASSSTAPVSRNPRARARVSTRDRSRADACRVNWRWPSMTATSSWSLPVGATGAVGAAEGASHTVAASSRHCGRSSLLDACLSSEWSPMRGSRVARAARVTRPRIAPSVPNVRPRTEGNGQNKVPAVDTHGGCTNLERSGPRGPPPPGWIRWAPLPPPRRPLLAPRLTHRSHSHQVRTRAPRCG